MLRNAKKRLNLWEKLEDKIKTAAGVGHTQYVVALCEAFQFWGCRALTLQVDTLNMWLNQQVSMVTTNPEMLMDTIRESFKKQLHAGTVTLRLTRRWIKHTLSHLISARDARVSVEGLRNGASKDYETLLYVAMTELIVDFPHC